MRKVCVFMAKSRAVRGASLALEMVVTADGQVQVVVAAVVDVVSAAGSISQNGAKRRSAAAAVCS